MQAPVPLIEKYRDLYRKGWDVIREEKWPRMREPGLVEPHWQLPNWRDDLPRWSDNGAQAFDNTRPAQRQVSPSDPDSNWSMGSVWASLNNMPFRYAKQSQHQGGKVARGYRTRRDHR